MARETSIETHDLATIHAQRYEVLGDRNGSATDSGRPVEQIVAVSVNANLLPAFLVNGCTKDITALGNRHCAHIVHHPSLRARRGIRPPRLTPR